MVHFAEKRRGRRGRRRGTERGREIKGEKRKAGGRAEKEEGGREREVLELIRIFDIEIRAC